MNAKVYLASASPRRLELLSQIGIQCEVLAVDIDERWDGDESARQYVDRLALAKADAGLKIAAPGGIVIGADTAVVIDDSILGKPDDSQQAAAMLELLSARCHRVYSAVAVVGSVSEVRTSVTRVCFRHIEAREITAYWQTGEPAGKAGGYAIQGLGAMFISRIEGSYSGVMGLPLYETSELLRLAGVALAIDAATERDK